MIWRSFFIVKQLSVPFIVITEKFTERNSSKDLTLLVDVFEIDVLKNFAKFTE